MTRLQRRPLVPLTAELSEAAEAPTGVEAAGAAVGVGLARAVQEKVALVEAVFGVAE